MFSSKKKKVRYEYWLLIYNKFKSASNVSFQFLDYYSVQWVQHEEKSMEHLITKNIVSSLIDQALTGKKTKLLKSS